MKLEFSRHIFENSSNAKFHENPFSGSRVVSWEQTEMTNLISAFRNFANAPKISALFQSLHIHYHSSIPACEFHLPKTVTCTLHCQSYLYSIFISRSVCLVIRAYESQQTIVSLHSAWASFTTIPLASHKQTFLFTRGQSGDKATTLCRCRPNPSARQILS
jgi:hypothetical protein